MAADHAGRRSPGRPVGGAIGALAQLELGLRLLFEGARFLRRQPSLWPLAVVPVLFSLVAIAVTASLFLSHLGAIVAWCRAWLPVFEATDLWSGLWVAPATFLVWIAGGLAVVVAFAVALVGALLAANVASAPFLEHLSARVETIARGGEVASTHAGGGLAGILRSFAAELQRIGLLASIWALLTGLGLVVPGAQLLTAPALLVVTVLFLPLEYAGPALDRRGIGFVERLRLLRARWPTMIGFGGVAFLACFLPGFNLVLMPVLVTAGTLLVVGRDPHSDGAGFSDLASFSESDA
ncbi:MAG: EI24 domain-containing protein [Myxococcota bacterium]